MRLVDADALKEEVNKKKVVGRFNTLLLIDNAPTEELNLIEVAEEHEKIGFKKGFNEGYAQAQVDLERPQGEWINHRNDYGHNIANCSECGKTIQWHDEDEDGIPRYCWYCGAVMQKGGAK